MVEAANRPKSISAPRPIRAVEGEVVLACNGCVACCRGQGRRAPLEPDDDPSEYDTYEEDGVTYLASYITGTCVYLGTGGCTIWERRPNVCRRFDCRREINHPDHLVRVAAGLLAERMR